MNKRKYGHYDGSDCYLVIYFFTLSNYMNEDSDVIHDEHMLYDVNCLMLSS